MNTLRTLTINLLILSSFLVKVHGQNTNPCLQFNLRLMPDNITWGVYVKADVSVAPSFRTSTGSGQVTLVVPVDFKYKKHINHAGTWIENARVDSPREATDKSYVSFGFLLDEPRIVVYPNEETLLFTFVCDSKFQEHITLFDNENDPFATPNSLNTNPGNDLGMIDYGANGKLAYYTYSSNYSETPGKWKTAILASRED